jgi:GNAT superfamily N-acetyltransferase
MQTAYSMLKMPMHNIREAIPNDSPAIKQLISETLLRCVLDKSSTCNTLFEEICELLDSWISNPEDIVHLVCEDAARIIGVVFISHYERMNLLFVEPTRQKGGIGRALVDRALEICRQTGKTSQITLNSSNYAEPFYLNYGFAPHGKPEEKPGGCIPMILNL